MQEHLAKYHHALSTAEDVLDGLAQGKSPVQIMVDLDMDSKDLHNQAEVIRRILEDMESADRIIGMFQQEMEKRHE